MHFGYPSSIDSCWDLIIYSHLKKLIIKCIENDRTEDSEKSSKDQLGKSSFDSVLDGNTAKFAHSTLC